MSTREKVLALLGEGLAQNEIARRLRVSKSTVAYHVRRVREPDPRFRRRYDWSEIQRYYDAGHSITECQVRFGFSRYTWNAARLRGAVVPRPHATPIHELFVAGPARNRKNIRMRLIAAGLRSHRCESCLLTEWQGSAIPLQLHHVNGQGNDNRLENLRLLCPNCHSLTDNWGGRGIRRLNGVAPGLAQSPAGQVHSPELRRKELP